MVSLTNDKKLGVSVCSRSCRFGCTIGLPFRRRYKCTCLEHVGPHQSGRSDDHQCNLLCLSWKNRSFIKILNSMGPKTLPKGNSPVKHFPSKRMQKCGIGTAMID